MSKPNLFFFGKHGHCDFFQISKPKKQILTLSLMDGGRSAPPPRVTHTDFGMGGTRPPMGGDRGPMGGIGE